jgi:carboxyl-terminal processing protease
MYMTSISNFGRRIALSVAVLLAAVTVHAGDDLAAAYTDILRGDVTASLARVSALKARGVSPELDRLENWVQKYQQVATSREEMIRQTFDWHVDHARTELAKGSAANLFLALTFAARASDYAADKAAFAKEPWVRDLTQRVVANARQLEANGKWAQAHAHYLQLERIHGEKGEFKKDREAAARHVRVEVLYEDRAALDRRIADVDQSLLSNALRHVSENYYERPDFKKLALGGLEGIETVAGSKKLRKYLDGLANDQSRALFEKKLKEIRAAAETLERPGWRSVFGVFSDVLKANQATVELPEGLLIVEFLEGALNQLDDFTSMIWPADAREFDKMMLGGFEGVGIQLGLDEETGRLKVVTPLENSPALEAGVQPDDLIAEVDGRSTKGWSTDDAVREIMGPAGTTVTLTMFRPSTGQTLKFPLKRRQIVLKTVRGIERVTGSRGDEWNYMLDPDEGIAYLRLTGFHPDSDAELDEALRTAKRQGMKALILDLRYNPGGLLDVAVDLVSEFLSKGEVVSTRGRRPEEQQRLDVTGRADFAKIPLVVLVNDASASASEILAGALQDHNRAVVIGQRTFGKGSVQRVLPLGRTPARLKLTTAIYYLPDGRSPHRAPDAEVWGVDPDIPLKLTLKEERQIIQRQNRALIIRNGRNDPDKKPTLSESQLKDLRDEGKKSTDDEDADSPLLTETDLELLSSDPVKAPDVDPQVELALLQLRVKLAAGIPWPAKVAVAGRDNRGG